MFESRLEVMAGRVSASSQRDRAAVWRTDEHVNQYGKWTIIHPEFFFSFFSVIEVLAFPSDADAFVFRPSESPAHLSISPTV